MASYTFNHEVRRKVTGDRLLAMLYLAIATLGIMAVVTTCSEPAHAHAIQILKCDKNLKVDHVTKVNEWSNENGTYSEGYDRNDDGKVDIEAISHIFGTTKAGESVEVEHAPLPFLYVVDLDFDGTPDAVYIDRGSQGKCEDIVLYRDLRKPWQKDLNHREEGSL